MTTDFEKKFWKALKSDMTVFLGCDGALPRPMGASVDEEKSPIWFFTTRQTDLGKALKNGPKNGNMTFSSKGNDIWASASGQLTIDNDPEMIDRLWSPFVAAWYEGGKTDPNLALVRYDAKEAQVWESGSSIIAGIKMLMGNDPKKEFEHNTAHIRLDT
ncbi:General stress protein 26 [Jannaschia faecimaris]|uniref:General stress protein 26 n=1 Tax=Jannaschia faecimaris TaxID=1244108 RepID=A0A1H3MNK4_9RHOB|nr:pyridoxamine 5'-phosphate oxidase family protein [Jannaschia faecimaris]SDY78312.1 General stress protein 26 [Jannaschia faecimaris]